MEPPGPIEPEDWPVTLAQLDHEKLTGIATAAAEDGWLPLKADQFEDLVERHCDAMAWCLHLERLLLDIADAFDAEEIEFLVLKGPALARVVYPDPSWRVFHDLDLLIRTKDWRRAVAVLERDFGPRRIPEPRRGWDERFGKGAVFTTREGQQIDLHRTLAEGPMAFRIEPSDLFPARRTVQIGDTPVPCPGIAGMFVHACIHSVLGDRAPRLARLRDIASLAHARTGEEQQRPGIARRWDVGAVIGIALEWTFDHLSVDPHSDSPIGRSEPGETYDVVDVYLDRTSSRSAFEWRTLRSIPSMRERVTYVAGRLFPQHSPSRPATRLRTLLVRQPSEGGRARRGDAT
jgi:hypothetical protein